MRCPACGHENPADANFCNACAAKIERTCPHRNKVNPKEVIRFSHRIQEGASHPDLKRRLLFER